MNIGSHHLPFFVDEAVAQADSVDSFRPNVSRPTEHQYTGGANLRSLSYIVIP